MKCPIMPCDTHTLDILLQWPIVSIVLLQWPIFPIVQDKADDKKESTGEKMDAASSTPVEKESDKTPPEEPAKDSDEKSTAGSSQSAEGGGEGEKMEVVEGGAGEAGEGGKKSKGEGEGKEKEEKKKEPEPDFEVLSNPARVLPQQVSLFSLVCN